jgi:hypothetical protein
MHRQRPAFREAVEHRQRSAAVDEEILADDFEPIDLVACAFQQRLIVLRAQAESETGERAVHAVVVECVGSGARGGRERAPRS